MTNFIVGLIIGVIIGYFTNKEIHLTIIKNEEENDDKKE